MRGSAVRVRTLAGWLGRAVEGKTTFLGLACIYTLWLVLGELRYRYEMHAMGESSYLDTAWTLPSVLKPYGYTASWSCGKVGEVEVKQRGSTTKPLHCLYSQDEHHHRRYLRKKLSRPTYNCHFPPILPYIYSRKGSVLICTDRIVPHQGVAMGENKKHLWAFRSLELKSQSEPIGDNSANPSQKLHLPRPAGAP